MSGGRDFDVVPYRDRTTALTVTLDGVANDGEPGENDAIAAALRTSARRHRRSARAHVLLSADPPRQRRAALRWFVVWVEQTRPAFEEAQAVLGLVAALSGENRAQAAYALAAFLVQRGQGESGKGSRQVGVRKSRLAARVRTARLG